MNLGEHITQLRQQHQISQAELAAAMEVSRQSVSKWETGASVPDLEKLVKLAAYFQISLDELVTGHAPTAAEQPAFSAPDLPKRSKAKTVGIVVLCAAAFIGLISVILLGVVGLIFAIPLLLFGLICFLAQKHPFLKATWATYFLLSLYFHYATAISPSNILLTGQWTYSMNYGILMFSWIWFAVIAALVIGTALSMKDLHWSWSRQQTIFFAVTCFFLILSKIPIMFPDAWFHSYQGWISLILNLRSQIQLASMAALITILSRWIISKRDSQRNTV